MRSEDEVLKILSTHYATVSSCNTYKDFLRRKDEAGQNVPDFVNAANSSDNRLFKMREVNFAISAAGNSAAGPDNILYSILKYL